ncbi:hypothetical protein BGZ50_005547 [Haplosporangium sp. Z 11]|nr:hypothetical protein BGZ50_005547 [Haplosporangium sp. Z 11]
MYVLPPRPPTSAYPSPVLMTRGSQGFLKALSAPAMRDDTTLSASTVTSDLEGPFQVKYQHLYEKHYLDRLIHAFYVKVDGRAATHDATEDVGRISYIKASMGSSRLSGVTKILVMYPCPSELHSVIEQARNESGYDLSLLVLFLTEPSLRFRLCLIIHLLDVSFAIGNGEWTEHPRELSREALGYVMQKLQDLFMGLFQQSVAQASLRRFLSVFNDWISTGAGIDADEQEPDLPPIIKQIFPGYDLIVQELQNIKRACIMDPAFESETKMLLKFVMLSLREQGFVSASDWAIEGRIVIENLKTSIEDEKYRGPAKRLIRNLVAMTDQLWEGGIATDTSLAIEKCLATVINRSLQVSDGLQPDQGADDGVSHGWDVVGDFERLIQALSQNVAPVPLPRIVWEKENSEICLDSVVFQFPTLTPSNIHLNSIMEFDQNMNRLCRRWYIKISGLEVEAKNVAFNYATTSILGGRMADVGELNLLIPSQSLEIDVKFTIQPPIIRRGVATALRQSKEQIWRKHPMATAVHQTLYSDHPPRAPVDNDHQFPAREFERRTSESSVMDMGRDNTRAGTRLGQEVSHPVTEDISNTTRIISRILYPNQPQCSSDTHQRLDQVEQRLANLVLAERTAWIPPRHRFSHSNDIGIRTETQQESGQEPENNVNGNIRENPSAFYSALADTGKADQKGFVELNECRVHIRKLDVNVHGTKHPIVHSIIHPIFVRQLRKALEQTSRQAILDTVELINISVDEIMGLTDDELQKRHGGVPLG